MNDYRTPREALIGDAANDLLIKLNHRTRKQPDLRYEILDLMKALIRGGNLKGYETHCTRHALAMAHFGLDRLRASDDLVHDIVNRLGPQGFGYTDVNFALVREVADKLVDGRIDMKRNDLSIFIMCVAGDLRKAGVLPDWEK